MSSPKKQAMRHGNRGFSAGAAITLMLFVLAAAAVAWVYTGMIAQERWPIRWLEVDGPFERVGAEQVRARLAPLVSGSFFTVNTRVMRETASSMPWVASVSVQKIWPEEDPFRVNRHELVKTLKEYLGRNADKYNFNTGSDAKSLIRYRMHTLPTEIGDAIGTSTLFAAWNAAIYVGQIEDERLEPVVSSGGYLDATADVLHKHNGIWFNDETFVISRKRDR